MLYRNSGGQPRTFTGLVNADGSGVVLEADEVVDIDRAVADRFLTGVDGEAKEGVRSVTALPTMASPGTPEPEPEPETPTPAEPPAATSTAADPISEAQAELAKAEADVAAAKAAENTTPSAPAPETPAPTKEA